MTQTNPDITRSKLAGLAMTSLCILLLELTLTRIFSVTMWYHFAFVAISVALLGISMGSLAVFLLEKLFRSGNIEKYLALSTSLMAVSTVAALIVILKVPFVPKLTLSGLGLSGIIFGTVTIPFFLGGICISLLLWRHAIHISRLYFFDLFGAALGCLATLIALNFFTGPQVMLLAAVMAACASVCFGLRCENRFFSWLSRATLVLMLFLFFFARSGFLTDMLMVKHPLYAAQRKETNIIFEKWNSFSRVTVSPPVTNQTAFGWGLSTAFDGYSPEQMAMVIDAAAGTQLVHFDGDFDKVAFLKYDITFLVHWLKKNAKTLVIGPGGGRDILAALVFGQKPVVGVEINPIIVEAVQDDFRNFVGGLYQRPEVDIHVDEGRSFLSRSTEKYDIIQASFIDTWAATSSGAYVLTENNLYTVEAFEEYLEHLNDDGMLTFSRWYYEDTPGEALRLMALAIETLGRIGNVEPRKSLLLAKKDFWLSKGPDGAATLIIKKSPFSQNERREAEEVCRTMGFQIVCSPNSITAPVFEKLFDPSLREELYRNYPLNLVPPDDDKPFFFHMARLRDAFSPEVQQGRTRYNVKAITVLGNLIVAMAVLAFLFLIAPLVLFRSVKPEQLIKKWKHLLYFVLIGLGFISVEIPLIQKFTLFLGHPIYSLAVVLSSLLLFSSLGSALTGRSSQDDVRGFLQRALLSLVLLLIAYLFLLSPFIHAFIWLPTYIKIPITIALIAPSGWLMGMPFPLGIKMISADDQFLIPWCWSLNGAFSVLASVASVAIAITAGFSIAMGMGTAAYLFVFILVTVLLPVRLPR